jgi:hypothetical protein
MKPTRSRRVGGKNLVEFLPTHRHQATTTEVADAGWAEHIHKDRTSAEACQTGYMAQINLFLHRPAAAFIVYFADQF